VPDEESRPVEPPIHEEHDEDDAVAAGPGAVDEDDDGPPEADGERGGEPLAEVLARLGGVEEGIAEFHRRSAHRETVIDRLHQENQRLRAGVERAVLQPVVTDLIRLYDQLDREARRLGSDGAGDPLFRSFADDVAQVLDRCGLEMFTAEPGEPFQHERHRPLAVVPCDDESRHNTVAEVVAAGFIERETGRIRRPVQARFHQYVPPRASEAT
jgi:molecular chaperone GrpE